MSCTADAPLRIPRLWIPALPRLRAGVGRNDGGTLRNPFLTFVERRDDLLVSREKPVFRVHVGEHVELVVPDRAHHALAHDVRLQPLVELALERVIARLAVRPAEARRPGLAP